jgi:organic radical activating enzyme
MQIEWECVLDCNYNCKYCCANNRNPTFYAPIQFEKDKEKVFQFLNSLKEKYKDDELFIFGGEPFLHPFLDEIIEHLNKIEMKFIIQTNFSIYNNIEKCVNKNLEFEVQVSVHPEEIKNLDIYIENLSKFQNIIRRIDIMYIGDESINYYKKIFKVIKNKSIIFLAPVADFIIKDTANNQLFKFNELKRGIYGKIFQFEPGERSFIWENQQRGITSMKFQPCIYKNSYILFDPTLKSYSCSYRENNDICPHDQCFLM